MGNILVTILFLYILFTSAATHLSTKNSNAFTFTSSEIIPRAIHAPPPLDRTRRESPLSRQANLHSSTEGCSQVRFNKNKQTYIKL